MLSQDKRQFIYSANHEGLLEFNGSEWTLYPSPNETIIRSVRVIGETIFTGCYMEFGFWKRNASGRLEYTSLSRKIGKMLMDDEQFWNILDYDRWVVFQSLNRIYIYDTKNGTFKIIRSEPGILKVFKTASGIFYQPVNGGIFELENGKSIEKISGSLLKNLRVVNLFEENGGLLLVTHNGGFFRHANGNLLPTLSNAVASLGGTSVYSAIRLSDKSLAIGSVSNGLFVFAADGRLKYHLTQDKGLSNNTVLSLFEDKDRNLWMGLDNGIDCLNISSPIRSFTDNTGFLGTVYASLSHNGMLYVGTNQGLFCKPMSSGGDFRFIPGTKGQVWSLFAYQGSVFCGHDSGTFLVSGASASMIYSASGTWKFIPNPRNPDEIIQGNYYGMTLLQKSGNTWKFKDKIPGFAYSTRFFETKGDKIYVSHEYKGLFELSMNRDFSNVEKFRVFENPGKSKNAGLASFGGQVLYSSKEGIFKLDDSGNFVRDELYSGAFSNRDYTSGKMISDGSGRLWIFTKTGLAYFTQGKLSPNPQLHRIPIPSLLTKSMQGYENISAVGNSDYLVGTTDGYYILDPTNFRTNVYSVSITAAVSNKMNEASGETVIGEASQIPYKNNNLTFSFTVPEFDKYTIAEYSYQLDGLGDDWSAWSDRASVSFKNLPFGDYVFKVKAKTGSNLSRNVAEFRFTVERPWYFSWLAIGCYFVIFVFSGWFINRYYKQYYQKEQQKLIAENQRQHDMRELATSQELMRLKNEQLQIDVDSKNRELAASTMNLIKKNELLAQIKDDLKKSSDEGKNIKNVLSTINRNISEEDTWDLFKEAFNNADKDFLKTIKSVHPSLTPNDLRLCAYLRLNLSSKEIAPLLNISTRSVEIKRYRLRKKMDLPHEQGLVEYILAI